MTAWTPANLPKAPVCWWDAQDTSTFASATDGASVSSWASKGTSALSLIPGSGTPTYSLNAIGGTHPAMKTGNSYAFFKANYAANSGLPTGSAASSVFTVWKSQRYSYANELGYADRYMGFIQDGFASPRNSDDQWSSGVITGDRANIGVWEMEAGTNPISGLYMDGSLVSDGNRKTFSTPTTGQITLGNNNDGDPTNWGLIGEYMIFDYVLSYDDRQRLEGYLAWKWGLQQYLNTDHPYLKAAPTADPLQTGSTAWTPASLVKPASLWFDPASGMTVTAGKVTGWASRTGRASATVASGWAGAPTTTVNAITVPSFDGSSVLSISDPDSSLPVAPTPMTLFVVAANGGGQAGASPISWGQESDGARRSLSVGGGNYYAGNYADTDPGNITWQGWYIGDMASTTAWGGLNLVTAAQGHGASSDNIEINLWKNGSLVKYGLRRANAPSQIDGALIGAQINSTDIPWVGSIAEIIILNYFPSQAERQYVEGYLAWRWGTQSALPTNHPYAAAAPTVGASTSPARRRMARLTYFF